MPWSSPSRLDQSIGCPASCVLPKAPDVESSSAQWGHEVHAWKDGKPPTKRLEKWLAEGGYPANIRETLWPGGEHEVILWANPDGHVERLYELPEDRSKVDKWSMFYIIDWMAEDGLVPHLDDLKTGRFPPASATQNWAYAWAYLRWRKHVDQVLVSVTHWPRYPKGNQPTRVKSELLDREQVMAWWGGVVIPAQRLAQGPLAPYDYRPDPEPDGMTLAAEWPNANGYCRWCRSKPHCPEMLHVPKETE